MFTEAPLPRDLHRLRPLTFYEAALWALRRRKSSESWGLDTSALPIFPSLTNLGRY